MFIETLDRRMLMSVSVTLVGTQLQITSNSASDTVSVNQQGQDIRIAPAGQEVKYYADSSVSSILFNGNGGNDKFEISLTAPVDEPTTLNGGDGNDTLRGGSGNDQINGNNGNDSMIGQAGHDSLTGGTGGDVHWGGIGNDLATFADHATGIYVDLDGTNDDGSAGEGDNVQADIENITGGTGNDRIVGSSANNHLVGNGGDDSIMGGNGNDTLDGSAGNDRLDGGRGADSILGNAGDDILIGGADKDSLYGGSGDDYLFALDGVFEVVNGGSGTDMASVDSADARSEIEIALL